MTDANLVVNPQDKHNTSHDTSTKIDNIASDTSTSSPSPLNEHIDNQNTEINNQEPKEPDNEKATEDTPNDTSKYSDLPSNILEYDFIDEEPTEISSNNPHQVEKIIYYNPRRQIYFVKWNGQSYKNCSWTTDVLKETKDKFLEKSKNINNKTKFDIQKLSKDSTVDEIEKLSKNASFNAVHALLFNSLKDAYINHKKVLVHTHINDKRQIIFGLLFKEIYNKINSTGPYLVIADSEELELWKDLLQNNSDLDAVIMEDDEDDNEIILKYEVFLPPPRNDIPKVQILIIGILTLNNYKSRLLPIEWSSVIIDDPAVFADAEDDDYISISNLKCNSLFFLLKKKFSKLTDEYKYNIVHVFNPAKFSEFQPIDENTLLFYTISTEDPHKACIETISQKVENIPEKTEETKETIPAEYEFLYTVYDDPHKDDLWTADIRDQLLEQLLAFGWGRWREIRRGLPSSITATMVMDGCAVLLYLILINIKDQEKLLNETIKQAFSVTRRQQWYVNGPIFGNERFKNLMKREAESYAKRIICISAISRYQNAITLKVIIPPNLRPCDEWDESYDIQLLNLVYTNGWGNWREILTDKSWEHEIPLTRMKPAIIKKRLDLIVDQISGYQRKVTIFEEDDEKVILDIITCCRIIFYAGNKIKEEVLLKWLTKVTKHADAIIALIDPETAYEIKSNYDFMRRLQSLCLKVGSRFESDKDFIDRMSKYRLFTDYSNSVDGLLPILTDNEKNMFSEEKNEYLQCGISEMVASDLAFFANMHNLRMRAEKAIRSIGGWRGVPDYVDIPENSFGVTLPFVFSCGGYDCTLESLGSGNYFLVGNSLCREGLSVMVSSQNIRVHVTVDGPFSFTLEDMKTSKKFNIDNLRDIIVCGINTGNRTPESFLGLECGEIIRFFDNTCKGETLEQLGLTEYVSPIFEHFPSP